MSERPLIVTPPPGKRSRELSARLSRVECPAFDARREARADLSGADQSPIVYARGEGANVWDVDGNRYVDLVAGFGALVLGHAPAEINRAVSDQLAQLSLALGDVFASELKVTLCERLARLYPLPGARVLLGSSGADAVTAALKTAALRTGRGGVVAFEGAYHGLSHGPLAACGLSPAFREPFSTQLGVPVEFARYPRTQAEVQETMDKVRRALKSGRHGAVLVEPILGRGGCRVPPRGFLAALAEACREAGALFVVDEIWTGMGRSGSWLLSLDEGVSPDVLCLGKGLGAGVPISACIGSADAMFPWGAHGGTAIHTSTHAGAPLGCAAALATLDVLERDELPGRAKAVGQKWIGAIRAATHTRDVDEVDGCGLMLGVRVSGGAGRALALSRQLMRCGFLTLTGGVAGDTLTLTPPLGIEEELLDAFVPALTDALALTAVAKRGAEN